jgi:DNA (cytosine-5)-methyltransferase 1
MSQRKILVADLLCGAGGSSTGAERALRELGLDMELVCVNHWQTAIDTHTLNHPKARHFVQDIATVRPHLLVPEGYLDLLMASPTCTHHSAARGGKPTSDQQRSDPWHIITWLTELRVKRIIIENVWEFTGWGPVNPKTGKPIPERKGEYFYAWIETLRRLGFEPEWRKLNAADYGDATTRQRFILMARSDGRRVHWPTPTHARRPDEGLALFPTMKPWRPAREIIDWGVKGRSIFDRKKPLAAKTWSRAYAGAVKFGWPRPFLDRMRAEMGRLGYAVPPLPPHAAADGTPDPQLLVFRQNMSGQSVGNPVPTITANGQHIGLAEPIFLNLKKGAAARSGADPLFTQTADASHQSVAEPILLSQHNSGAPRSADDPLPTITTGGAGAESHPGCARPMLIEPFVVNGRKNNQPLGVDTQPIPTLDTKGGVWLAESFIATVAHGNTPGDATADTRRVHSIDHPLGAMHAGGGAFAMVEPFVLSQASGGAPRGVSDPIPTQTTGGAGGAHALISPYYGSGSGETCTSDGEPLPTVTSKGRFGVVIPVTNSNGGPLARDVEEPLPTMTTAKGGEFAVVMPVTHHDGSDRARDANAEPLPTVTGANRGELAFITAEHGERAGQAPRVHSVDEPTPTIAASGHTDLVMVETDGYDILFRMLEPHELAAAMGFTDEDQAYEFAGTKTDQIKQIGNAVSVSKMKACVGAIMADAAPRKRSDQTEPAQVVAA